LAERRTKLIQNKINLIRNKIAKQLVEVSKTGDAKICKDNFGNPDLMATYCDDNVIEDYAKNLECKTQENFCFVCCDSEFGKANISGKDACYNKCLEKENLRGAWVRVEPNNNS